MKKENKPEKKMRMALYSRVSSDERANEGVSIEAQQAALKAYAKAMNWEVFDTYVDGGFPGGTFAARVMAEIADDYRNG
jgi:site-specific DNA recombinase